jgi:hypothetical protein
MQRIARKIVDRIYPPAHLVFYLQRLVLNPGSRNKIANFLANRLPKSSSPSFTAEQLRIVQELQSNGFSHLPDLVTVRQREEISAFLNDKLCYDRWRPENGAFPICEAPPSCHVAPYHDADVVECPHFLEIVNHPDILGAMEKLLGCKPTLSNLSVWWSLPGHGEPEDAELFHRDVDEWHFVKLFIYLTDVDASSGPHVFVKGSPAIPKLLPIRRYQDSEVEREFGAENIIQFTGKAGTAFLENTFGLHKGQLPKTNPRLLLQAQYSLFPVGIYKYSPRPAPAGAHGLDPYINRLYRH